MELKHRGHSDKDPCNMGPVPEGRTKSDFYAARVTQLYRKAINDAISGRPFDWSLMDNLEGLSLRGYTESFYRRHVPEAP